MPQFRSIQIEKEVLLFEIARRCSFADCNQRVSLGLTKAEAFEYRGFECSYCERWNEDVLTEGDVPDWWDEIQHQSRVN
ncbi:MAG TPA: hypothetical protein VLA93_16730 [Pyrinomonadaceae bacterium]|nr:hypothetical protein [Pyrinomonadaceae bacterium]